MRTIGATEFKAKCLRILDRVARTGEPVLILKRGRPVAELRPPLPEERAPQRALVGSVRLRGDVVAPPLPADVWEAAPRR